MERDPLEMTDEKRNGLLEIILSIHAHLYAEGYDKKPSPLVLETLVLVGIIYGHAFLIARNKKDLNENHPLFQSANIAHMSISKCLGSRLEEKRGYFGICFSFQKALLLSFVRLFLMEVKNGTIEVSEECEFEMGQLRDVYADEIANLPDLLNKVLRQDPDRAIYFSTDRKSVVRAFSEQSHTNALEDWVPTGSIN